jgi:glycosyltransferase involved in cell wall biosynthesis
MDLLEVVSRLHPSGFRFRFVGCIEKEVAAIARRLRSRVEFVPRQRESALSEQYAWGDLFFFPTLQDGFAVVLAQANAACLPVLTTTNSAGPDLVIEGRTGWILPVRKAAAFVERLLWCQENRSQIAGMVEYLGRHHRVRDWNDVAVDFEATMYKLMARTHKCA